MKFAKARHYSTKERETDMLTLSNEHVLLYTHKESLKYVHIQLIYLFGFGDDSKPKSLLVMPWEIAPYLNTTKDCRDVGHQDVLEHNKGTCSQAR